MCYKFLKNNTLNEVWNGTYKTMKLDHRFTPHTRINSKWIKDLNISHNTIKVQEENIGSKISDTPHSDIFADTSSRAREIKEIIHKWDYIKLKISTAKENITKVKRELTAWEKYLPMIPQTAV